MSRDDQIYNVVYSGVCGAVEEVKDLGYAVEEAETIKKITRYITKNVCNPDKLTGTWQQVCETIVTPAMQSYQASCSEKDWFFDLQLVPVFSQVIWMVLVERGRDRRLEWNWVEDEVGLYVGDTLERALLERAMWEATCLYEDDTVRRKLFQALSKAYWKALDATILEGGRRIFDGGNDHRQELALVEGFTRKWMEDALSRGWSITENTDSMFTKDTVVGLFTSLIAPYGEENPFSCIPAEFTKLIGRPPLNWPYMDVVAKDLFRQWNKAPMTKKRKKAQQEEDMDDEPPEAPRKKVGKPGPVNVFARKLAAEAEADGDVQEEEHLEEEHVEFNEEEEAAEEVGFDEALAEVEDEEEAAEPMPAAKPATNMGRSALAGLFVPKGAGAARFDVQLKPAVPNAGLKLKPAEQRPKPAEQKPKLKEPRMPASMKPNPKTLGSHPLCTSDDECIGDASMKLVRHILDGTPGDGYCEACWKSFKRRNPSLEGVVEDED